MAFAPYTNDRRTIGVDPKVLGQFREKDFDNFFEFAENDGWMKAEYPHKIFVQDGTRAAKILKTVAYVIVDEDDHGPLVEKWAIKNFRGYA